MSDVNLYKKVNRLHGLLQRRKLRRRANQEPASDPTRGQGRILAMLKLQDGISTKDLSYLLDLRVASLNEALAKLERAGLIVREPSEADRRVMLIKLTDAGREQPQQTPDTADVFSVLTAEEQETLSAFLDRIIEPLAAEADDINADGLDDWLQDARTSMGDEKFDQWMGLLGARAGDDAYRMVADRIRRSLDRAERRVAQAADREDRRRGRRGPGWGGPRFGPGYDDPDFGPGPRGPEFGPGPRPDFGPGPHGPGFGPGPRPPHSHGPHDPRPDFGPDPRDPRFGPDADADFPDDGPEPPEGWR